MNKQIELQEYEEMVLELSVLAKQTNMFVRLGQMKSLDSNRLERFR